MTYTEDELIEKPAINLFSNIGWQTLDCYSEVFGEDGSFGRDDRNEVTLVRELRKALTEINSSVVKMRIKFLAKPCRFGFNSIYRVSFLGLRKRVFIYG